MSTENEISFLDLVLAAKEWTRYLKSKWKLILLCGLLGGIIGFFYAYNKASAYKGELIFVLSNESPKGGTLAGLATQFGLDLANNNSSGAFDGENITQLLQSRTIITGALFKKMPNQPGNLINYFARSSGLAKKWEKEERLKGALPFPEKAESLSPVQDSLVNEIKEILVKSFIDIDKVDKKLSFYSLSVTSNDEKIAVYLTDNLVEEASSMYIKAKTKVATDNLAMLQREADSLRILLGGSITSVASTADQTFNLNPALQSQRVDMQKGELKVQVLSAAYTEVLRNLEIAKITLQKETPLYQIIDEPRFPLKEIRPNVVKWTLAATFLFMFLISSYLIIRYLYNKLLLNN